MARKEAIPQNIRTVVYERDGYRCCYCGQSDNLSIDHVHPEIEGGPIDLRNLATCCRSCNSRKGTMPVSEFIGTPWHVTVRSMWGEEDYKRLSNRLVDSSEWWNELALQLARECGERYGVAPTVPPLDEGSEAA